jgi:predicted ArsR family transcriptional regulator
VTSSDRPARQQSRARILAALREAGERVGVAQLCEQTGLSAGSVRFHLSNLLRAGSVRAVHPEVHANRGRPVVEYEALPVDAADPAEAYRVLAAVLGGQLRRSRQPHAAFEAGRHWAADVSRAGAPQRGSGALETVTELLRVGGFAPSVRDSQTVELHQCPYYELATELPSVVCAVHHGLTSGALERAGIAADVRVVPVIDGSGPCLVHVQAGPSCQDSDFPSPTKEIVP